MADNFKEQIRIAQANAATLANPEQLVQVAENRVVAP
jgi:hypothetical protein